MQEKSLSDIRYNYLSVVEKIAESAVKSGRRPEDITLLAATKTVAPEFINYAIFLGLRYIGENRVQELLSKYDSYNLSDCSLHFIGHLQTNKVRQLIGKVSMIQSVDSARLASEISDRSIAAGLVTDILVEVNIGGEDNKSGIDPSELELLLAECGSLPGISVKGLMTVPPICDNTQKIRRYFAKMNKLFIDMKGKNIDNISMNALSMGMSADYCEAILEGATIVRVGSAIFGARN